MAARREVSLMDMGAELLNAACRALDREYSSTACAACGTEKWANSHFCRLCSIALQRAGMMRILLNLRRRPKMIRGLLVEQQLTAWYALYDAARDFLANTRGYRKVAA